MCGYVYAGAGYGESTTDLVFAGYAGVYENGRLLAENERFRRASSLTWADVDVERLRFQRARSRSFFLDAPQGPAPRAGDACGRLAARPAPSAAAHALRARGRGAR